MCPYKSKPRVGPVSALDDNFETNFSPNQQEVLPKGRIYRTWNLNGQESTVAGTFGQCIFGSRKVIFVYVICDTLDGCT